MGSKVVSRLLVAAGIAAGGITLVAPAAGAAKPAEHACLGESFSSLARHSEGAFGAGIVSFARGVGLGGGIQQVQGGFVPDEVVPNTCND